MKWMRGYVAGLLTALLVCGLAVTAGARTGKVMQELDYRDIRVSLDGKILDLRNAIGEKVEPFMFGGTNYLPVRALAEALGLNVAWDGKEVMVVLTTPEPEPEPEVITVTPTTEPNAEPLKDPAPEAEAVPADTDKLSGNLGEYHVEIKGARLAKSYDGKDAIGITYVWKNNSDKATSAILAFMERAYQNGTRMDTTILDDDHDESMTDILPGATQETESAFLLESPTAPVQIEITEYLGDDAQILKATFNPEELPKAETPAKAETPKAEEKSESATPAPAVKSGPTVYITNTGKRYHYSSTCNGGHYFPVTLSEAVGLGLTPCDKCA